MPHQHRPPSPGPQVRRNDLRLGPRIRLAGRVSRRTHRHSITWTSSRLSEVPVITKGRTPSPRFLCPSKREAAETWSERQSSHLSALVARTGWRKGERERTAAAACCCLSLEEQEQEMLDQRMLCNRNFNCKHEERQTELPVR